MISILELEPLKFYEKLKEIDLDEAIGLLDYSYGSDNIIFGCLRKNLEDFYVKEVVSEDFIQRYCCDNGNYLLYTLEKRGLTTFEAIKKVSRLLKVHARDISYLGLKDKDAITEQYITVKSGKKGLLGNVETDRIKLKLVGRCVKTLSKDYLEGNFFKIVVRDVISLNTLDEVKKFKELVDKHGFANFYGYQRFGASRPINHKIGLHLLRKEYEYAAKTLVGVPGLEEGSTKAEKKLKYLENDNIELLSDVVYGEYEKRIIKHLNKNKSDYKGAMMKLHPSLLRLFIEAFSCYIFNLLVSGIIKKSGIKNVTELSEEGFFIVPLDKYFAQIEAVVKNEGEIKRAISLDIKEKKAALAVAIPGYLTGEVLTEEMRKILNFFKVDPKMFFMEEKPEASYPGQYRAIVSYVKEFYFSNLSNDAIELEFFLPRGSFATVLLRELVRKNSTLTKNL